MTATGTMVFLLLLLKKGEATSCRSGDCTGVIITGGYGADYGTDVELFPANTTCMIPPFPSPGRYYHSLSVINDTLVACGGMYTLTSCISWKKGQDGWEDFHTLSQERYHHVAVVVDSKEDIIILGGPYSGSSKTTGEIVKSGKTFELKNMGYATCAVSYQGAVVMMGGGFHGKVDRYDSKGNYLDSLPDLLEARYWHACTTFTSSNGEEGLLVAGGYNDDLVGSLSSTELYLPSKKRWTRGGDLPRAMNSLRAVRLLEHVVVTGGRDDGRNSRNEVLQYEEITGVWSEIGKMKKARSYHAVVDVSLFCSVDCKVEDWSSWSDCSATCGGGTKTRGRGVVQEAENGGAPCPALEEEESCNTDQCPGTTDANSNNGNGENSATTLTASWFALAVFFTLFR